MSTKTKLAKLECPDKKCKGHMAITHGSETAWQLRCGKCGGHYYRYGRIVCTVSEYNFGKRWQNKADKMLEQAYHSL